MVEYECDKCHKKFDHKGNYDRHISKKISCLESIKYKNNNGDNKFVCNICNIEFNKKYNLQRHLLDRCGIKKSEQSNNLLTVNNEQQKLIEKLTDELKLLKQNKTNEKQLNQAQINGNQNINGNHNINGNNNGNTNITINVMAYGKENLSHLTDDDYKKIFCLCNTSVPEFIKLKHFNKDHPENSNVYIPSLTGTHGYMYDGKQWNAMEKHQLLSNLYDDNCDFLIDKYNEFLEKNGINNTIRFDRFIDKHENEIIIKDTGKKIEMIAYNNREIAKSLRRIKY
jgi:hypothetical protein